MEEEPALTRAPTVFRLSAVDGLAALKIDTLSHLTFEYVCLPEGVHAPPGMVVYRGCDLTSRAPLAIGRFVRGSATELSNLHRCAQRRKSCTHCPVYHYVHDRKEVFTLALDGDQNSGYGGASLRVVALNTGERELLVLDALLLAVEHGRRGHATRLIQAATEMAVHLAHSRGSKGVVLFTLSDDGQTATDFWSHGVGLQSVPVAASLYSKLVAWDTSSTFDGATPMIAWVWPIEVETRAAKEEAVKVAKAEKEAVEKAAVGKRATHLALLKLKKMHTAGVAARSAQRVATCIEAAQKVVEEARVAEERRGWRRRQRRRRQRRRRQRKAAEEEAAAQEQAAREVAEAAAQEQAAREAAERRRQRRRRQRRRRQRRRRQHRSRQHGRWQRRQHRSRQHGRWQHRRR